MLISFNIFYFLRGPHYVSICGNKSKYICGNYALNSFIKFECFWFPSVVVDDT